MFVTFGFSSSSPLISTDGIGLAIPFDPRYLYHHYLSYRHSSYHLIKPFSYCVITIEIDDKDNGFLLTGLNKISSPLRANAPEYAARQHTLFGSLLPPMNVPPINTTDPFGSRNNSFGQILSPSSRNLSPSHAALSSQPMQHTSAGSVDPMARWPTATRSQIPMKYTSLKPRQHSTQDLGYDHNDYGAPPGKQRNQDQFPLADGFGPDEHFEGIYHKPNTPTSQSRFYGEPARQGEALTPTRAGSMLNRGVILDPLRSFRPDADLDQDDRLFSNLSNEFSSRPDIFGSVNSFRSPPKISKELKVELVSADGYIYKVNFKRASRNFVLHRFASMNIKPGDFVKVEADRGEDLGVVIEKVPAHEFKEFMPTAGYRGRGFSTGQTEKKTLLRLATLEECAQLAVKFDDEERALEIIRCKVAELMLPMIILDAEYQYDRHKLVFFFEADKRVDFRELVSDLFSLYKTRIWMQQVDTSTIPDDELDGDFTKSPLFFHAPSRAPILSHQHQQLLALQPAAYTNQETTPPGGDRLLNASLNIENREIGHSAQFGDSPLGELGGLFNSSSWSYGDN